MLFHYIRNFFSKKIFGGLHLFVVIGSYSESYRILIAKTALLSNLYIICCAVDG